MVQEVEFPIRIIQVKTKNEKFQGMAASDIGFSINSQIVAECAAM